MTLELPPMRDDLSFNSPLSEARAAELATFIGSLASGRIVNIGCGWAPCDYGTLADLVDIAVYWGFHPLQIGQATMEEWDAFESGYSWGFERWLMSHPDDHSHAANVRNMAADHRTKWLRGYRGILGFGYLALIAH